VTHAAPFDTDSFTRNKNITQLTSTPTTQPYIAQRYTAKGLEYGFLYTTGVNGTAYYLNHLLGTKARVPAVELNLPVAATGQYLNGPDMRTIRRITRTGYVVSHLPRTANADGHIYPLSVRTYKAIRISTRSNFEIIKHVTRPNDVALSRGFANRVDPRTWKFGGVVLYSIAADGVGRLLMVIHRNARERPYVNAAGNGFDSTQGGLDFPGGKVYDFADPNVGFVDDVYTAALREFQEETGSDISRMIAIAEWVMFDHENVWIVRLVFRRDITAVIAAFPPAGTTEIATIHEIQTVGLLPALLNRRAFELLFAISSIGNNNVVGLRPPIARPLALDVRPIRERRRVVVEEEEDEEEEEGEEV
jgi:8-oxo-dGTP pyrophosphatase MutT (NUDIX family)